MRDQGEEGGVRLLREYSGGLGLEEEGEDDVGMGWMDMLVRVKVMDIDL